MSDDQQHGSIHDGVDASGLDLNHLDAWLLDLGSSHETDELNDVAPPAMPGEVFARLQGALEGLETESNNVALLAAHRRRKRATWLLGAAAAVGAFVVLPQLVGGVGGGGFGGGDAQHSYDSAGSSTTDQQFGEAGADAYAERDGEQLGGGAPPNALKAPAPTSQDSASKKGPDRKPKTAAPGETAVPQIPLTATAPTLPTIAVGKEMAGLKRVIRLKGPQHSGYVVNAQLPQGCSVKGWPAGIRVLVRYEGTKAVVILIERPDNTHVGTLFRCGSGLPVVTATVHRD